jgi:hypothetical protein
MLTHGEATVNTANKDSPGPANTISSKWLFLARPAAEYSSYLPVCFLGDSGTLFRKFIFLGLIKLRSVKSRVLSAITDLNHWLFFFVDFAHHLVQPIAGAFPAKKVQQAKDHESNSF